MSKGPSFSMVEAGGRQSELEINNTNSAECTGVAYFAFKLEGTRPQRLASLSRVLWRITSEQDPRSEARSTSSCQRCSINPLL